MTYLQQKAKIIEKTIVECGHVSLLCSSKEEIDVFRKFYKITIEPFGYVKFERLGA